MRLFRYCDSCQDVPNFLRKCKAQSNKSNRSIIYLRDSIFQSSLTNNHSEFRRFRQHDVSITSFSTIIIYFLFFSSEVFHTQSIIYRWKLLYLLTAIIIYDVRITLFLFLVLVIRWCSCLSSTFERTVSINWRQNYTPYIFQI